MRRVYESAGAAAGFFARAWRGTREEAVLGMRARERRKIEKSQKWRVRAAYIGFWCSCGGKFL